MKRRGFALLAVLWTLTLLSALAGAGAAAVRLGQRTTANRVAMLRGRWAAEACLAVAEARAAQRQLGDSGTIDLGRSVRCAWHVDHPDARLDANRAPRASFAALAVALGAVPESAQRCADTVVEARREKAVTDVRRLAFLPGCNPALLAHFTADGSGRVDAYTAPPVVLASLPGVTPEAAALLIRRREAGRPIRDLDELAGALSPAGRGALYAHYAELTALLAFGSNRIALIASGWVQAQGRYPEATIEVVAERLPDRLAVLRRRLW
jgi:general secretion pathway protein K